MTSNEGLLVLFGINGKRRLIQNQRLYSENRGGGEGWSPFGRRVTKNGSGTGRRELIILEVLIHDAYPALLSRLFVSLTDRILADGYKD